MYEPFKSLSEVSEKRLQAVRNLQSWDQGFKIAMPTYVEEQVICWVSNNLALLILSVFDLSSQMLKEAVDIKQGKKVGQIWIRL